MNKRIAIIGGGALTARLVNAIQQTGHDVVIVRDHMAPPKDHTKTLGEILGELGQSFEEPAPVAPPSLSRRERRGGKSEAFYARRDQIARKGGR